MEVFKTEDFTYYSLKSVKAWHGNGKVLFKVRLNPISPEGKWRGETEAFFLASFQTNAFRLKTLLVILYVLFCCLVATIQMHTYIFSLDKWWWAGPSPYTLILITLRSICSMYNFPCYGISMSDCPLQSKYRKQENCGGVKNREYCLRTLFMAHCCKGHF